MAAKKTEEGIIRPETPEKDLGIKAPYINWWTAQTLDLDPDDMGMPIEKEA